MDEWRTVAKRIDTYHGQGSVVGGYFPTCRNPKLRKGGRMLQKGRHGQEKECRDLNQKISVLLEIVFVDIKNDLLLHDVILLKKGDVKRAKIFLDRAKRKLKRLSDAGFERKAKEFKKWEQRPKRLLL